MNKDLIIKVCGMREAENISAVSNLDIDWMGFIFYPKSQRYVSQISSNAGIIRIIHPSTRMPIQGRRKAESAG